MNSFFVGVDLGQQHDYTAVCIIERYGELEPVGLRQELTWTFHEYRLQHLERHLGEPYTSIVDRIVTLLKRPDLKDAEVIVDNTGVGRGITDLMKDQGLKRLVPVSIHGGDATTSDFIRGLREWRTPKKDLVATLQVLFETRRLKIPATIGLRDELIQELQNFRAKVRDSTGHTSFEAWRSGDHDDLVLSLALPLWYAESQAARMIGAALIYT